MLLDIMDRAINPVHLLISDHRLEKGNQLYAA